MQVTLSLRQLSTDTVLPQHVVHYGCSTLPAAHLRHHHNVAVVVHTEQQHCACSAPHRVGLLVALLLIGHQLISSNWLCCLFAVCAVSGTGKTSTARVLAGHASLPLVYVPLESLVSKWYGESEQNMAKVGLAVQYQIPYQCSHKVQSNLLI